MTDVVTALSPAWEGTIAGSLEAARGVTIARRCADVSELLSVAEAGVGRCAVVSADLRGLDLEVVGRLRTAGLRVVGVLPGGDEAAERRLRQLSVRVILPIESSPENFAEAITEDGGAGDGLDRALRADSIGGIGTDRSGDRTGDTPWEAAGSRRASPLSPDVSLFDDLAAAEGRSGWQPAGRDIAPTSTGGIVGGPHLRSQDDRDWAADGAGDAAGDDGPGDDEVIDGVRHGRIIAVWGPAGAPGRTTVAVTLAAELASRGEQVLLADLDTYGGCVAQTLGLLDEAPGIAAACRAADQGTLDLPVLARMAPEVTRRLRVLTGIPKAERWPELRGAALERVLELSRGLARFIVVDCGFSLENDEELSYDTAAPRRNEATLTALATADDVLAIGGADPVALQRFVRGLQEIGAVQSPVPTPVVNRVRASAVGARPESRISESLMRFAGLEHVHYLPDDQPAVDGALLAGRSVIEHAPQSALRMSVAELASSLAPSALRQARPRVGRRRRTRRPSGRNVAGS